MSAGIPITYVPARNTIFLAIALGLAEVLEAFDISIGANAIDFSGYPDCRPEYLQQFEKLAGLATKAGVEGHGTFQVRAPRTLGQTRNHPARYPPRHRLRHDDELLRSRSAGQGMWLLR